MNADNAGTQKETKTLENDDLLPSTKDLRSRRGADIDDGVLPTSN
jgi:hypothetical protein